MGQMGKDTNDRTRAEENTVTTDTRAEQHGQKFISPDFYAQYQYQYDKMWQMLLVILTLETVKTKRYFKKL